MSFSYQSPLSIQSYCHDVGHTPLAARVYEYSVRYQVTWCLSCGSSLDYLESVVHDSTLQYPILQGHPLLPLPGDHQVSHRDPQDPDHEDPCLAAAPHHQGATITHRQCPKHLQRYRVLQQRQFPLGEHHRHGQ